MEKGGEKRVYVVLFGDTNTSISRESSRLGGDSEIRFYPDWLPDYLITVSPERNAWHLVYTYGL